MSEWISVKERLPDSTYDGSKILIIVNNTVYIAEVMERGVLCSTDNRFLFSTYSRQWNSDKRFSDPTHWMPLPKPPAE